FLAGVSGAILGGVPERSNSTNYQALASLSLIAILAIASSIGGGGTIVPAFVAGIGFTYLPSYVTESSDTSAFAFQMVFGLAAVTAALLSNGRGTRLFAALAARGKEKRGRSPVRARTEEAEAREEPLLAGSR